MTTKYKLAVLVLALGAAMSAQAADWYVGGAVGTSHYNIDWGPGVSTDNNDTGLKLLAGVKLMPNFAIEAGYADLGKAKATDGTDKASLKVTALFIDAVGIAPLSADWSLFGRLGLSNTKLKVGATSGGVSGSESDTSAQVHWGLGGQYNFNKSLGIRVEWERFRGEFNKGIDLGTGDADLLSIGLTYQF